MYSVPIAQTSLVRATRRSPGWRWRGVTGVVRLCVISRIAPACSHICPCSPYRLLSACSSSRVVPGPSRCATRAHAPNARARRSDRLPIPALYVAQSRPTPQRSPVWSPKHSKIRIYGKRPGLGLHTGLCRVPSGSPRAFRVPALRNAWDSTEANAGEWPHFRFRTWPI